MPSNTNARDATQDNPSVAERMYRKSISMHRPNEPEDAMAYRVALATLRDQAAAALPKCTDEAAPILQYVSTQASLAVYGSTTTRKLFAIKSALDLTFMAARSIEWAARADG